MKKLLKLWKNTKTLLVMFLPSRIIKVKDGSAGLKRFG
jgi:hypothetical protein